MDEAAAPVPRPRRGPLGPAVRRALLAGLASLVLFWRILRANVLSLVGFVLVAIICLTALVVVVAPHLLVPYGPTQITSETQNWQPPSWQHPFGTDGNSYDIYSNVMLALPLDLGIGIFIAGISLLGGGALGLVAGYWDRPRTLGGATSVVILRITDIFLAFPSLILALAISVSLGRGVWQTILAVTITWWPYYVRLVRGEVLAVKHLPYVSAARAAGVKDGRIVLRHILRNVLEPVVVYFTLDIGTVLVTFSTIGFVAHAIPYPSSTPEWGSMISYYQGNGLITAYPWTVLAPGAAIFITVLAFSLLGDGLRDVLDPRSRRILAGYGRGTPGGSSEEGTAAPAPATGAAGPAAAPAEGGGG
ncbi:MAG TPA: ABC transporter permease [Thermoplasmata archaeon]|nr:ABC transporter permease [Thermoplasmata archaeon]